MLQTLIDDTKTSDVIIEPETPGEAKILFLYEIRNIPYFGRSLSSEKILSPPKTGVLIDLNKFYESLVGSRWNGVHYSKLKSLGSKLKVVSQEGTAHPD